MIKNLFSLFLMLILLVGCGSPAPLEEEGLPPAVQQVTPPGGEPLVETQPTAGTSPDLAGEAGGGAPGLAPEAIVISNLGTSDSRVTSPLSVLGIADPAFKQTLGIRLVLPDGSELATSSGIVDETPGARGNFTAEVSFEVSQETVALLQVFAVSPRDGGITHLAARVVTLAPNGEIITMPGNEEPEAINILLPAAGQEVSGGKVLVGGTARPSFEGHLLVEVLDLAGNVVGSQPVTVAAEPGQWGEFMVEVPYALAQGGPGRVVVHDPSAMFAADIHLASVEVVLNP